MKQIAALVAFTLATLAVFALIVRIGGALAGHRDGGIAFVVMSNGAPRTAGCGSIRDSWITGELPGNNSGY
jgi:hypothetical protein